ncbi:MAG: transcription termination factor Rho [Acidimicrobiia bacterium]|nr:transcription termination factor Rho [Acidimicrobiia bacterium]
MQLFAGMIATSGEKEACVSVDAHELERTALQKKDREQLQAIAKAMGGKPSSRARKDQIIEMIMGLAGVPSPMPPAASTGPGTTSRGAAASSGGPGTAEGGARRGQRESEPIAPQPESSLFSEAATVSAPATAAASSTMSTPSTLATPSAVATPSTATTSEAAVSASSESSENGQVATPSSRSGEPELAASVSSGEATSAARSSGAGEAGPAREGSGTRSSPARFVFDPGEQGPGLDDDFDDVPLHGGRPGRSERGEAAGRGERSDNGGRRVDVGDDADQGGNGQAARPGRDPAQQPGARTVDVDPQSETGSRRRRRRGKDRGRPDERMERPDRVDRPEREERRDRDDRRERDATQGVQRPAVEDPSLEPVPVTGYLDLREEGYGFLRVRGLLPSKEDVYVPSKFVRQFSLRKGDHISGSSRPAGRGEKNPALLRVDRINGEDPERARSRPRFEDLTPLFPDEKLPLELRHDPTNMTARIIDLIAPIGKGQRGLIVSPPKAGKTTIMKQIAQSIEANNPEVKLIVLLVDERPEEVTDMRRSVRGEVVASTFDRPSDEHTAVAELTIERAKRMVEMGEDVVIILDGITRLARAYNLAAPATGRIMSGGIDTGALYPPKKFFGAARNVEEGGSLTILATALVETGSKMDEVIFEEFKGTGNMELRLDRRMAEKRIYPAIDVDASSTRHEELLFERKQLQMVWKLRRVLSGLAENNAGLELLIDRMKTFRSNDEFLSEIAKAPST